MIIVEAVELARRVRCTWWTWLRWRAARRERLARTVAEMRAAYDAEIARRWP
jgi:hypothetical protein